METQNIKEQAEDLISHSTDYLDTFLKVSLLNITKRATTVASATISVVAVCVLGMFILFFGGFGLAWWLGDVISSRVGGFMLVAAFFLLVMIVILLLRKKIVFPFIRNLLIRKVYE